MTKEELLKHTIPDGYIIVPASAWDEMVQMEYERDALATQIEALSINRDAFREAAYKAVSIVQVNKIQLPKGYGDECLREIQAEAVRAGFVSGAIMQKTHGLGTRALIDQAANSYADFVRQGGE